MKGNNPIQLTINNLETPVQFSSFIILNKEKFVEVLNEINTLDTLDNIKNRIIRLRNVFTHIQNDSEAILNIDLNGDTISIRKDILISELNQILEAQTLERAKYYLRRLESGVQKIRTCKINDINLYRWKEYDEIITDSLWVLDKRDTSGAHLGWYWGNFIPQIPHQMMLRYTKKGDWVLDTFVGSGTTLIECRRLGRNGIGIELNPEVAQKAKELLEIETNNNNIITDIIIGDSRTVDIKTILNKHGVEKVHLIIMHPPYQTLKG